MSEESACRVESSALVCRVLQPHAGQVEAASLLVHLRADIGSAMRNQMERIQFGASSNLYDAVFNQPLPHCEQIGTYGKSQWLSQHWAFVPSDVCDLERTHIFRAWALERFPEPIHVRFHHSNGSWTKLRVTPAASVSDMLPWLLSQSVGYCLPGLMFEGTLLEESDTVQDIQFMQSCLGMQGSLVLHEIDSSAAAILSILPQNLSACVGRRFCEKGFDDIHELRIPVDRPPCFLIANLGLEELDVAGLDHAKLDKICRHRHVSMWTSDQRAGIKGTLHRLTREVQRASTTCTLLVVRFGRHFLGCCDRLAMHISSFKSTLLVGPPGVGKTTFLREYTRVLSEVHHRRVVVIDTSMEIGGVDSSPHSCIGKRTDRVEVTCRGQQFDDMVRAVQNLNPQSLIIDEICTVRAVSEESACCVESSALVCRVLQS